MHRTRSDEERHSSDEVSKSHPAAGDIMRTKVFLFNLLLVAVFSGAAAPAFSQSGHPGISMLKALHGRPS
jgi:hypothetical protein